MFAGKAINLIITLRQENQNSHTYYNILELVLYLKIQIVYYS